MSVLPTRLDGSTCRPGRCPRDTTSPTRTGMPRHDRSKPCSADIRKPSRRPRKPQRHLARRPSVSECRAPRCHHPWPRPTRHRDADVNRAAATPAGGPRAIETADITALSRATRRAAGPVERALRDLASADPILLLRAKAHRRSGTAVTDGGQERSKSRPGWQPGPRGEPSGQGGGELP